MSRKSWLLCVTFVAIVAGERVSGDESVSDAIRSLREQVNALLDHRQQDYNALEGSLKRAIEKNTELFVLKNEIKQLRKEVISLRDGNGNGSGSGSGNEAKNERLRVRWLGNAVTELQGEVAEVLRTRNASQELAERSRMKGEVSLLKGDVAAVGKGIRNLGGRIAKIEAVLGTIRVDIAAVKERFSLLSRTCADIASQLSSVQMEVKSLRCESPLCSTANSPMQREGGGEVDREREREREKERGGGGGESAAGVAVTVASSFGGTGRKDSDRKSAAATERERERERERGRGVARRRVARRHGYWRRSEGHGHLARLEDRLKSLERKMSLTTERRTSLETRIAAYRYENQEWSSLSKRIKSLEKAQVELSGEVSNVNEKASSTKKMGESLSSRLVGSLRALEYAIETNNASVKRELMRLSVNAARKAAELSLTREELNSLRRTVQAVSVSASKLQERSDKQQEAIDRLNRTVSESAAQPVLSEAALPSLASLEQLEDRYHLIGDSNNLTEDCSWNGIESRNGNGNGDGDGLRLVRRGQGARPMLVFCREGWTVIARRIDGTLDFDRSWSDYAFGFGSPVSEYWIGNEILHRLTRDNCSSLRIDMSDIYGERWRAEYQWFAVESEEAGYRLSVRGYTGNATDALSYQNGMRFSAKDRDMDASAIHCARNYHGGWWFSRCQHANLNGKYSLGLTWFRSDSNRWLSIASSEMSLRLNSNCRSR